LGRRASAKIGSDGKGEGGIEGLLEQVGRTKPEVLAGHLVYANVPTATGHEEGASAGIINVTIVSVPGGAQRRGEDRPNHLQGRQRLPAASVGAVPGDV
jgi:hypothetical protein